MNLDVGVMKVSILVRLGRRVVAETGEIKSRLLSLSVNLFDHKRQILKANALLRECKDDIFGNICFTPDLIKSQKKEAFLLRVERRSREEKGKTNLKISRGKMITTRQYNQRKDVSGLSEPGAAPSSSPSASEIKKT